MLQEESSLMQKATSTSNNGITIIPKTGTDTNINNAKFIPSKEQMEAISLRLMPEVKKFFADERTQKEFNAWKEKQKKCK